MVQTTSQDTKNWSTPSFFYLNSISTLGGNVGVQAETAFPFTQFTPNSNG
ncbi:MAG: hypothetical protein P1U63_06775 [Coxiellaceae bacterium]|nr:hypothetical protein [Coxiellaceae bacterium]